MPVPPSKQESTGKDDREDQTGAFVPNYFYDALREKKRFDSMRVSPLFVLFEALPETVT